MTENFRKQSIMSCLILIFLVSLIFLNSSSLFAQDTKAKGTPESQGIDTQDMDTEGLGLQGMDHEDEDTQGMDREGLDSGGVDTQDKDTQGLDTRGDTEGLDS